MMVEHIFAYEIPGYVQYRYKMIWYFPVDAEAPVPHHRTAFWLDLCLTAKTR